MSTTTRTAITSTSDHKISDADLSQFMKQHSGKPIFEPQFTVNVSHSRCKKSCD